MSTSFQSPETKRAIQLMEELETLVLSLKDEDAAIRYNNTQIILTHAFIENDIKELTPPCNEIKKD